MSKNKQYQKQKPSEKLEGTEEEGLLIGHYGTNVLVETGDGEKIRCHLRKNMEPCIPGDYLLFRRDQNQGGIVVQIMPRQSLFFRVDRNKQKLIAANIDSIVIVTAPPPLLSLHLIDSYLVASEYLKIPPIILLNKIDLLDEKTYHEMQNHLSFYQEMGYPVIYSSIFLENGLQTLSETLKNKTSVLVGVSGVGKSSIIASLTHSSDIMIGDTAHSGLGKHTTTTTHLYHLPKGGNLIDSPGVREFTLWHLPPEDIMQSFIEFQTFSAQCKFRDCSHRKEPGCAVIQALEEGKITKTRYESYCQLLTGF